MNFSHSLLAKSKRVGGGTRGKEANLERVVANVTGETHQLIQPLPVDDTVAVGVGVDTVIGGRRMAID